MVELSTSTAGNFARRLFVRFPALTATVALAWTGAGWAQTESSVLAPLAPHAALLDISRADSQLVAVGDRGHLLLSADNGQTWTQSLTPTRAMLTGVAFPDAQHGWAVGHDGVILATTDGGKSWVRQDDGKNIETIYLDVCFIDAQHGFVVGAYGKFLATNDGGKTWTSGKPTDGEVHFNRLTRGPGGELYLAGESGTALVSIDQGQSWTQLDVPYQGSLYGILPLADGGLVAYGLRGHIYHSADKGVTWVQHNEEIKVLIMAGSILKSGTVVLAGQGGHFFISRDHGRSFHHWQPDGFGTSVADLVEGEENILVSVGEAGAVRIPLSLP